MRALLLLLAALLATPALAQNAWSVNRTGGGAVMDETSSLFFTVANAATSRDPIHEFTLSLNAGAYDIEGGGAPVGWRASTVDRRERTITYRFINTCAAGGGLRPGQSAVFEMRVTGISAQNDVTTDSLRRNRTAVNDVCNTGRFPAESGNTTWTRHALGATVSVSPRSVAVNGQVTVTLAIANRSTQTKSGITPVAPTLTGSGSFALVSGPTPAAVNSLAVDSTATFTWVYRATSIGVSAFNSRATSATATSPLVPSLDVSAGRFPAMVTVSPTTTISGGTVSLLVQVTNNTGSTVTTVLPQPPTFIATGDATATLLTGPQPASVTSLSVNATTAFRYTYRVQGSVGTRVTFTSLITGIEGSGAMVASDPVRSASVLVAELALLVNPDVVLSAAGVTTLAHTVSNGGAGNLTSVVVLNADNNLFRTPTAVNVPAGWTSASSNNPRGIRFTAGSAGAQLVPGASQTFSIRFASIGTVTAATPTSHRVQVSFASTDVARAETNVTVATTRPIPDVAAPAAVAQVGRVDLAWNNPSLHDGVLILRAAGSPPNTPPVQGLSYAEGATLGNATVVFADTFSFASNFTDTNVTSGATYYYRLYNRDEYRVYSPGSVPAASPNNHLLVVVPTGAAGQPVWCSSVGLAALQQPFTDLGRAVYQSSNGSFFTGNLISTGASNGGEKWRPSLTRAVVQARPAAQRIAGEAEPSLFVGDQQGYTYRLSGATGAITWTGNAGAPVGQVIQAQAVVALRQFGTTAFQAAYPVDLVFFATRNSTGASSVRALRADTGAQAWSYAPVDLGAVQGAPLYDAFTQSLWVGSLRATGPSLRVLDVVNPTTPLLTVTDLADVPSGVVRAGTVGQALVVDRSGVARGYSLSTRAQLWQASMGGTVVSPLVPYLTDFVVSTSTGVQRWHIDTATNVVTPVWAAPTAMRLPSSVRIDGPNNRVFVGDADGFVRRLNFTTGALEASLRVSTVGGVSMPSYDSTAGLQRLYVGTADGRLCALPPTF